MAKLARNRVVDWTILAAGLALLGAACNSAEGPQPPTQSGEDSRGGSSNGAGGSSASKGGSSASSSSSSVTANNPSGGSGNNDKPATGGSSANDNKSTAGGASSSSAKSPATTGGAGPKPGSSGGAVSAGGAKVSAGGAANAAAGAKASPGGAPNNPPSAGGAKADGGAPVAAAGRRNNPGGAPSTVGTTSTPPTPTAGSNGGGPTPFAWYNPDFVEFVGEKCTVGEPKDGSDSTLPDLFAAADGTRISKKSDWACQRAYLKKVVEKYIHGEKPGKPEKVTGSVSSSTIKVHVEDGGKSIDFSVSVSMPGTGSGPVPAIIGLGGGSLDASILKSEGVATINYDNNKMADEKSRSGLFTTIYGSTGASAQVGWAWGVSRIIDVLVDEKAAGRNDIIDPTAIGVTGCSRLGKGAFTIGAFDERIALGIPQESGTGGVSAFRIVNTAPTGPNGKPAQSLDSAWTEAQGWFGTVFSSYKGKVNSIPGDTHSLVAMYAPRGLLVLDNSRIGELCASCQHAASAAGAEVYKALGSEKSIEYNGGNPSDPHNHCSFYKDTQGEPLKRAIRAFLTRKGSPDGRIAPQSAGTADLAKWIKWTAPTLAD